MLIQNLDFPVDILGTLTVSQLTQIVELRGGTMALGKQSSQARKKQCLEMLVIGAEDMYVPDNEAKKFLSRLRIRMYLKKLERSDFKVLVERLRWVRYVVLSSKDIIEALGLYVSRGSCEGAYQKALMHVLRKGGFTPCMERPIALYYPPKPMEVTNLEAVNEGYVMIGINRLDIEVNGWILELKALDKPLCKANAYQIKNYLKHTEYKQGVLVNFNQNTGNIEYSVCFKKC